MSTKISSLGCASNQCSTRISAERHLPCIRCRNTDITLAQKDFQCVRRTIGKGVKQPVLTRRQRIRLRNRISEEACYQAQISAMARGAQHRLPPGQGILPPESKLGALTTPLAEAIKAAVPLISGVSRLSGGVAQDSQALGLLATVDGMVNALINPLLPWDQAAATTLPRASQPGVDARRAAVKRPAYHIHRSDDNITLFHHQFQQFLLQIAWPPDGQLQRFLFDRLRDRDVIFITSPSRYSARPERAHEDVMKRRALLHEMTIRDKTVATEGIGAKIIAWGDEHSERGYTLFRKGTESYNPLHFLAAGGEVILGYFSRTVGELYGGTLLERLPGETQVERAQRWSMNWLMLPEQAAAKAFAARPVKPIFTAAHQPVKQLAGTLISHPPTGMTLHSVLQSQIAGQRWTLYPREANGATAVKPGAQPAVRRAASRSENNLWRVNGIEGEHRFVHDKTLQWFIQSGELYYPVKFSAADATAELPDGQVIFFHESSQQWRLLASANGHVHSRALASMPPALSRDQLGAHRVLASVGHPLSEVWSEAYSGIQFLRISEPAVSHGGMANHYLPGRLEGDFFSVMRAESQSVWQQTVLKWHALKRQWFLADSPFHWLQKAEGHIDLSWLRQVVDPQEHLTVVQNRPGLYRTGRDYFLRWQTQQAGVETFLPLRPTSDGAEYRTPQPGAAFENHFRYDEQSAHWQFLPLTSEAFFGLPSVVKVQNVHASMPLPDLPEYRHLVIRDSDIYLHTGADKLGAPEYVRVEQDSEEADLFSLRVPGEKPQPESLWRFRYDEDDEFVLEERRQCLPRIRRAGDEESCPGPSGISQQSPGNVEQPHKKKPRRNQQREAEIQLWLEDQTRSPEELLMLIDNRAVKSRKNMAYALRLSLQAPDDLPLASIARHAGVTTRRLSAILSRLSPQTCQLLIRQLQATGETDINYALRLYQMHEGFTPRLLADYTGVTESRIIRKIRQSPYNLFDWLRGYPRNQQETHLEYALRLCRLPEGAARVAFIAEQTGVNEMVLRSQLANDLSTSQIWLNNQLRLPMESDMDFSLRLYQQQHEKVTVEMIAAHTGIKKVVLLQRLGQLWKEKLQQEQEAQWFSAHPRNAWESDFDYALRLAKVRDEQVKTGRLGKKMVRNTMIAMHAQLSPAFFSARFYEVKNTQQWFNNHPRLPTEILTGITDSDAITANNKHYALRLVKLRHQYPIQTNKVKFSAIARHVGETESQLKSWVAAERIQWFSRLPRVADEVSFENADELTIQRDNQRYARRLFRQREDEEMNWLISDNQIADYAEVTLRSLRQVQDPLFDIAASRSTTLIDQESGWQPDSGLLHLQLKQNPPLLTDPKAPDRSLTRELITGEVTISNLKQVLQGVPKAQRKDVAARFLEKAQELVDSDGGRQDYFYDDRGTKQPGLLSQKLQIYYDEQAPQLGLQITAKEEIDAWEFIGAYTGTWHKDTASLREECRKMGSQAVHTYLWGVYDGDESVSAYQNANKLALINTAQLVEDASAEGKQKNNLAALYINGRVPGYYTTRKIAKDEPLLISYGSYYLADYMIQAAMQNDVVRIIAQKRQCWFVIKGLGDQHSVIFGPDGLAPSLPEDAQPYILKERLDKRGILRYDAVRRKTGRRIVFSKDDENNLYHAMAKALHPQGGLDIINEEMVAMKETVNQARAEEEGIIKTEPVAGSAER